MQGFGKGLKEIRDRFDTIMERAIKEHEEERKKRKEVMELVFSQPLGKPASA